MSKQYLRVQLASELVPKHLCSIDELHISVGELLSSSSARLGIVPYHKSVVSMGIVRFSMRIVTLSKGIVRLSMGIVRLSMGIVKL